MFIVTDTVGSQYLRDSYNSEANIAYNTEEETGLDCLVISDVVLVVEITEQELEDDYFHLLFQ